MVTDRNPLHVRQHGSLLAAVEKRALVLMAKRLPLWLSSDHLTLLGFAAMLMAGIAYWVASWNQAGIMGRRHRSGGELVWRQSGRNLGESPQSTETKVWLLCGPCA